MQTGSADPVTELSLFSSGWVVLFWFFVCVCVLAAFFFLSITVLSESCVVIAVSCVAVSNFFLESLI